MKKKQRIQFIDYLKAICVIMVIITHYDWNEKTTPIFTMLINMAVPIFMIVSGYNMAMSNLKKTDGRIKNMYGWKLLKPKLVRFLLPFFAVCLIEIIILVIEGKHLDLFRIFVLGAYGPGSYYVPILLQMLILFPLIFILMRKSNHLGLLSATAANCIYEVAVRVSGVDEYYYRLCIGRYILLIAFGCYLYLNPQKNWKKYQLVFMFMTGLAYIVAVFVFGYEPVLFEYWTPTAMPIAFYIFPIVVFLFHNFYHSRIPGVIGDGLAYIGKSSYHIFLVQMVYYHFGMEHIFHAPTVVVVIENIMICTITGMVFYEAENRLLAALKTRRHFIWRRPYAV